MTGQLARSALERQRKEISMDDDIACIDQTKFNLPTGYTPDSGGDLLNDVLDDMSFAPEAECEADPDLCELVVYTVVWRRRRDEHIEVLVGQRQPDAGEERLYGKRFLGWGGHVERRDAEVATWYPYATLYEAARREIWEELEPEPDHLLLEPRGTLYLPGSLDDEPDDSADHLGVAFTCEVSNARVKEVKKYGEGEWWNGRQFGCVKYTANQGGSHPFEDWSAAIIEEIVDPWGSISFDGKREEQDRE